MWKAPTKKKISISFRVRDDRKFPSDKPRNDLSGNFHVNERADLNKIADLSEEKKTQLRRVEPEVIKIEVLRV